MVKARRRPLRRGMRRISGGLVMVQRRDIQLRYDQGGSEGCMM